MICRILMVWVFCGIGLSTASEKMASDLNLLPDYKAGVESTLQHAGKNRAELERALRNVPENHRKGMQFLIAHMPVSDATSVKAELLLNNVRWAYQARAEFPWAKAIPESVFLNDVLPYASLNEPRVDWREDFYKRFRTYVKDAKSQKEAMVLVNQHIAKELKVEYNTKRKRADQSPYESMEQGMASCTGLSILLTDAFRAIGIPSRVAGIPSWTTKPGNHNWVEVWTSDDQQWHFTEYYMDKKGLDHGWLLPDVAQANPKSLYHSVYASSWKPEGSYFPLVWDMKNKEVSAVNVTDRYIQLGGGGGGDKNRCELRIQLVVDGKRVEVPVEVMQGDVQMAKGHSPKPTDDMNRYLSVQVRKGQIYQIRWADPVTGKVKSMSVTTPKDKAWLVVDL